MTPASRLARALQAAEALPTPRAISLPGISPEWRSPADPVPVWVRGLQRGNYRLVAPLSEGDL